VGLFFTHLHNDHMGYSECLATRLNPLAERTCFFSQALMPSIYSECAYAAGPDGVLRCSRGGPPGFPYPGAANSTEAALAVGEPVSKRRYSSARAQ
jgi:hypothetical protein